MDIREIKEEDARLYLELCQRLDEQSEFIIFEPGERYISVEEQQEHIRDVLSKKRSTLLVADHGNELIGFITIRGNDLKRIQHRATITLGVLEEFQGRGIGKQLMKAAEAWAVKQGIRRFELSVMSHNKQALWLYSRLDYSVEGIRRKSVVLDHEVVNEFYMSKMIE
ncbi:RimJ/RimL family protein N-acetyltransferase [Pullulanibacillus pueri]|uniref:N-acetyltransferase n=1 Tax=Pullulanibacillus pueri TaxID=1437324 RepID=A0A8J2ZS82_9BACL|nr:GNAT family N-acetyltransferase [Pullulanibacillus pueri]MBM7680104.1 RimJ/RimL family protein N-acetyltransferase [Pullulanibacillus pueri]GGH74379.1 N-acetyltransferase [Pullulanibacillus pueri]